MFTKVSVIFLLLFVFALNSCDSTTRKTSMFRNETNGIIYYLPNVKGQIQTTENSFRYEFSEFVLEVIDDRILLNNNEIGTVKKGDEIKLTEKGEVYLNQNKVI